VEVAAVVGFRLGAADSAVAAQVEAGKDYESQRICRSTTP
jgi:hypothetical protein